jgi:hypothetical protein
MHMRTHMQPDWNAVLQESKVGLSQEKAKVLMSEFFEARKKEREQEANLREYMWRATAWQRLYRCL